MKKLTKKTENTENRTEMLKKMDALTDADYAAAAAKVEGQEAYKTGSEKQVAYALDILADASIPCTCEPGKPYTFPAWHLYLTPAQIAIAKATMTASEIINGLSLDAVKKATVKVLEG